MSDATRGVILFVAGTKHNVHAAVCVASLRQHYDGPIALITEEAGPGRDACELIAGDSRLGPIQVIPHKAAVAGSHGKSYQSKTVLPSLSPFDVTVFLDADTLVVGKLDELWPAADEVVLTMFADWVSTGTRMQQRIKPWAVADAAKAGYTPDAQQIERVRVMLSKKWPAINTGVMAWSRSANCQAFAAEWHRVTNMRDTFIVDETACQIIFPEFQTRVLDDRFNASVVYPPAGKSVLGRDDVRIYHGHGGKFWKRDGSGKVRPGQLIYVPHYERALQENLGCIRAIAPYPKWFRQLDDDVRARLEGYLTAPV